jgi:hypothetical protein
MKQHQGRCKEGAMNMKGKIPTERLVDAASSVGTYLRKNVHFSIVNEDGQVKFVLALGPRPGHKA